MEDVEAQLLRIQRGTTAMVHTVAYVGTRLPYGYGQEYGRARLSGRLARSDGGTFFLTQALQKVMGDAERDLGEGLNRVTAPGAWVIMRLARWVRREAKLDAPVGVGPDDKHPGKLRRSINVYRGVRI